MTLNHSLEGKSRTKVKDFADLSPRQIGKIFKDQIWIASLSNFQCALNCFLKSLAESGLLSEKSLVKIRGS